MIGIRKPFNKRLHASNDPTSRSLVKTFFAERGVELIDHPNKFDIDLTSEDGEIRVEVEHRLNWTDYDFPYTEVNVPERKAKFFEAGNTHYVILSKNFKRIGLISARKIQRFMKPEHLKESRNRFVEEHEYFYKIPQTEFEFYDL